VISIDTLASALTPTEGATLLLRATLLEGNDATSALGRWQTQQANPSRAMAGPETVSLAPTLFTRAQGRPSTELDPRLATYLKSAVVHEQLRLDAFRSILRDTFTTLRRRRLRVLLTGGALNGETLYDGGMRHSHDIDLLVRPPDDEAVATALEEAGFACAPRTRGESVVLVHASGLPVSVHVRPLELRAYRLACDDVFARAQTYRILDEVVEGPEPEDRFLQACVNGVTADRQGVLWVSDAVLLARRHMLDSGRLVTLAQQTHSELALFIALVYLESHLLPPGAVQPPWLTSADLARLERAAQDSGPVIRETLLHRSWFGDRGSLRQHLARCRSTEERLFVIRAKVFPSLAALTASNRVRVIGDLPRFHWDRVVRLMRRKGWFGG
jgi:hypothetical protein